MSEHTITTPHIRRLARSSDSRVLAGVCGGLGRYFDLTPAVFRLGFVVLTVLGGAGILVYVAAVLVMPKDGEDRSIAEDILSNRRDHPVRLVALGLVSVAILSLLARADTWPTAGAAWTLVVAAGIVLLWTSRGRGVAVALVTLLTLVAAAVVAAVIVAFAWFDVSLKDGVGTHSYAPTALITHPYHLGIGKLKLDLTHVPAGTRRVVARVGIGNLRIVLPRNESASVVAHVKAGSIDALGRHESGTSTSLVTGDGMQLVVVADVGAGHLEVVRAQ